MRKINKRILKTWYVYGHFTKDTNELFYIGVGTGGRKNSTWGRNAYWKRIVEKHGFEVHVIVDGFSDRKKAVKQEVRLQLINKPRACIQYGDRHQRVVAEETLLKMSVALRGKKRSPEAIKNMSESKKGIPSKRKGVRCTDETRDRMRAASLRRRRRGAEENRVDLNSHESRNFTEIIRLKHTMKYKIGKEENNSLINDFYESCSCQFQKNTYQKFSGQFRYEHDEEFLRIYDQLFDGRGKLRTGINHTVVDHLCKFCKIGNNCK